MRRSAIHGRGAFAKRRIRPGTLLIEYTGERVSFDEAENRYDDESMTHHHTFLFQISDDVLIDAGQGGNDARFINHSCAPNCAAYLQRGRVYIEAIKNIQPGVELTYDYALQLEGRPRPEWKVRYACRCGASVCRGTVLKAKRKRTSPVNRR